MPISVLVVEDHPDLADVMTVVLRRAGMEVVTVHTGSLALAALEAATFDIILLDRSLPDMDGTAATAHMRTRGYAGVILIVSGHHGTEHENSCVLAGADGVMAKPFKMPELVARVLSAATPQPLVAM